MSVILRSLSLAMVFALTGSSGCGVSTEDPGVRDSPSSASERESIAALSCGQSPTSITYWASQWQRDILDADGVIGGCDFDASCLPSCWGATSDWTTWAGPLISCPCR